MARGSSSGNNPHLVRIKCRLTVPGGTQALNTGPRLVLRGSFSTLSNRSTHAERPGS